MRVFGFVAVLCFATAQQESSFSDDVLLPGSFPDDFPDEAPLNTNNETNSNATLAPSEAPTSYASECPLHCENGSVCKLGELDISQHPTEPGNGAPFTFLQITSRKGWYCDCPEGFTGLRCNREYRMCPSSSLSSSSEALEGRTEDGANQQHFCYHGGECIHGLSASLNGIDQRFCDCTHAMHNGTNYYGKYCEIEGAVQCGGEDSELFCTAQGTCKPDAQHKAYPCDCKEGHRGPHCEFMRGSVPECTLPCGRTTLHADGTVDNPEGPPGGGQGKCALGMKDFESARYRDFWSAHDGNYQYCKCPKGWFGDNCEVPGVECGNAHCFNGGACLESTNKKGETSHVCDCQAADHNGKKYAGQYCENEETATCNGSEQDANGHLFCTNGGTCKDPNNPHLGCDCPEDQFGPICEYHREEDNNCSLKCMNGGECRAGKKDNSLIESLGKGLDDFMSSHHSELFEHCVCPANYFGIQCEHKLEVCPGEQHICLHGSKCIPHNEGLTHGSTYFTCDCDSAFDALDRYAGKFCQYSSTDICTINGQPGLGKASFAFCVNDGVCKGYVDESEDPPGCHCPEGFEGDHCEILSDDDNNTADIPYVVDDDEDGETNAPAFSFVELSQQQKQGLVIGLSTAVIVLVIIFIGLILKTLLCPYQKDVQGALDAEEAQSADTMSVATACSQPQSTNTTGIVHNGSLEDIEVDDYVNNDSSILTAREMTNVQVV